MVSTHANPHSHPEIIMRNTVYIKSYTQIQYSDGTNLAASANLTFDVSTKTLTVDKIDLRIVLTSSFRSFSSSFKHLTTK